MQFTHQSVTLNRWWPPNEYVCDNVDCTFSYRCLSFRKLEKKKTQEINCCCALRVSNLICDRSVSFIHFDMERASKRKLTSNPRIVNAQTEHSQDFKFVSNIFLMLCPSFMVFLLSTTTLRSAHVNAIQSVTSIRMHARACKRNYDDFIILLTSSF